MLTGGSNLHSHFVFSPRMCCCRVPSALVVCVESGELSLTLVLSVIERALLPSNMPRETSRRDRSEDDALVHRPRSFVEEEGTRYGIRCLLSPSLPCRSKETWPTPNSSQSSAHKTKDSCSRPLLLRRTSTCRLIAIPQSAQ